MDQQTQRLIDRFAIFESRTPTEEQMSLMRDIDDGITCALAIPKEDHDSLMDRNPFEYPEEFLSILTAERRLRSPQGFDTLIEATPESLCPSDFASHNVLEVPKVETTVYSGPEALIASLLRGVEENVVVAGGCAVAMMVAKHNVRGVGCRLKDVDLFVHSCTPRAADVIVSTILLNASGAGRKETSNGRATSARKKMSSTVTEGDLWDRGDVWVDVPCDWIEFPDVVIMPNSVSFRKNDVRFQIIKRLYSSPAQIITGFDVDSCCVLYDPKTAKFWLTPRGQHAFKTRTNFVDLSRMSPTYEARLIKYAGVGFNVFFPFYGYLNNQCMRDDRWVSPQRSASLLANLVRWRVRLLNAKVDRKCQKISVSPALKLLWITLGLFGRTEYSSAVYGTDSGLNAEIRDSDYAGAAPKNIVWLSSDLVHHIVSGDDYHFEFSWKTLDPGEQIINTFHRIVLDDFRTWYDLRWEVVNQKNIPSRPCAIGPQYFTTIYDD